MNKIKYLITFSLLFMLCMQGIVLQNRVFAAPTGNTRILTPEEALLSKKRTQYLRYITYCILSNWHNPTNNNKYSAAFTISIDKNGKITGYDILRSSDSDIYTKAALKTLLSTGPFKPLPKEFNADGINLQVYFNGVEVQANATSKYSKLFYNVDQTNKQCNTIKIEDTKVLKTQSAMNSNAPRDLHWDLSKQVQSNWRPPLNKNSNVKISFRVLRTGYVTNIRYITKSYIDAADKAAMNAVKSLKLKPFPQSEKAQYTDITYTFNVENNDLKY